MGVSENSVPHCTQWFCWSDNPYEKWLAIIGNINPTFSVTPKCTIFMGKSTISMVIFHSYVSHYQRVNAIKSHEIPIQFHPPTDRETPPLVSHLELEPSRTGWANSWKKGRMSWTGPPPEKPHGEYTEKWLAEHDQSCHQKLDIPGDVWWFW